MSTSSAAARIGSFAASYIIWLVSLYKFVTFSTCRALPLQTLRIKITKYFVVKGDGVFKMAPMFQYS